MILGNNIGTDATGTVAIPNALGGIVVQGTSANVQIGGNGTGQPNIISGNGDDGIIIQGSSSGTQVLSNLIGVQADGLGVLGNSQSGVWVAATVTGTVIGGPGNQNIIAFNGDYGIFFNTTSDAGNTPGVNSFINNSTGGIGFLGSPVVEAPIINSISPTNITGTSNEAPGTIIEVYQATDVITLTNFQEKPI